MKSFSIFLIFSNLIILNAYPINEKVELPCSVRDDQNARSKRAAKSLSKFPKWPDSTVPYHIDCPNFSKAEINLLKESLNEIEQKTCVNFVELKAVGNHKHYIRVQCKPDGGCKSATGFQGEPQKLNLQLHRARSEGGDCMIKRKIQHEFMHALGFRHEINSPVRNDYVHINKNNIAKGWESYFDIDSPKDYESYGCPYDFNSIMHPDAYRHSKSEKLPTIVPINKQYSLDKIGKAQSMSECDITRIRNLYCKGSGRKG